MADYVWLITATSSGFGKAIALEALRRGYKVVATARDSSQLAELQSAGAAVLDLDVTASDETLTAKFSEVRAIYGKITHVINPAGYPLCGPVEAATSEEVFKQFNTNVLGAFNVARAAVPHLREAAATGQATGLVNFGSLGSWTGIAAMGHYCSTKWAVSGLTESLHEELKPFGINVCIVEPGYTRTEFLFTGVDGKERRATTAKRLPAYEGTNSQEALDLMDRVNGQQLGNVGKGASVIVDVLTSSGVAKGRQVPPRLLLGSDSIATVRQKCEKTLKSVEEWEDISKITDHDE
ncbi:NAD(P)-binding protein [Thozetella sp. PMI_491]|nr:NAD(P)-binding protein [Thozetella sp. PMI_491]